MVDNQIKHANKRGFAAFLPAIVVFALAAVAVVFVWLYVLTPTNHISAMETSRSDVGGVPVTNYLPILEEDVDWESLSDSERTDTARQAVGAAIDQAAQSGVTTFNVIGLTRSANEPIFLYSGGDTVYVYVGGEATAVPLEE